MKRFCSECGLTYSRLEMTEVGPDSEPMCDDCAEEARSTEQDQ